MKRLLIAGALLFASTPAYADSLDVIQTKLNAGCTAQQYGAIAKEFNASWGKSNGYLAEVLMPVTSNDLTHVFWVGRTASAAAFGKAWDTWVKDLGDPNSTASKVNAKLSACAVNVSRDSYDVQ